MIARFYLGTHHVGWLGLVAEPLFISHRRLARRRRLPRALGPWALDSGGFTELAVHGRWETSPADYTAAVRRYANEIGRLTWAAPQDWMCEPAMLARTGLTVNEHQRRTVANLLELRNRAPDLPFVPVLQGWSLADYRHCIDLYDRAGVDLAAEPVVGLGSVCRRQRTAEINAVVEDLARLGLRLHGFGVKTAGLARYAEHLSSADSLAWSFQARRTAPLPGCRHRNCANCLRYALRWRDQVVARLGQLQLNLPVGGWATAAEGASRRPDAELTAPGADAAVSSAGPIQPRAAAAVVAPDASRCAHCGRSFTPSGRRRGSPQRFCCPAHREAARLRRERELAEDFPVQPNRHGRRRLDAPARERDPDRRHAHANEGS